MLKKMYQSNIEYRKIKKMNRTLMACIPVKPRKESTFQIKAPFTIGERAEATQYLCDRKKYMLRRTAEKKSHMKNSHDSERPLCDVNAMNHAIYLAFICDCCAMKVETAEYKRRYRRRG